MMHSFDVDGLEIQTVIAALTAYMPTVNRVDHDDDGDLADALAQAEGELRRRAVLIDRLDGAQRTGYEQSGPGYYVRAGLAQVKYARCEHAGFRFVGWRTPLLGAFEGGTPEDHALFTLLQPFTACGVVPIADVHASYLRQKMLPSGVDPDAWNAIYGPGVCTWFTLLTGNEVLGLDQLKTV